ncbi:hypothetical protein [Prolixibacter sp. SD074]|uniref:hypothetical protein n=1 Tax=Prolixibacter sp. SD074 TaxID=2652391 RepID=UPI001299082F|nr:hypothetical protein [Prolixibacter sp. SD074]
MKKNTIVIGKQPLKFSDKLYSMSKVEQKETSGGSLPTFSWMCPALALLIESEKDPLPSGTQYA